MKKIIHFHGGCVDCTQQHDNKEGTKFCMKCQYFDANWNLPDLNNRPPTEAEAEKAKLLKQFNLF